MRNMWLLIAVLMVLVLLAAPAVPLSSAAPRSTVTPSMRGLATWYGGYFVGRAMKSGVIYDPEDMVAAVDLYDWAIWGWRCARVSHDGEAVYVRILDTGCFTARHPVCAGLMETEDTVPYEMRFCYQGAWGQWLQCERGYRVVIDLSMAAFAQLAQVSGPGILVNVEEADESFCAGN